MKGHILFFILLLSITFISCTTIEQNDICSYLPSEYELSGYSLQETTTIDNMCRDVYVHTDGSLLEVELHRISPSHEARDVFESMFEEEKTKGTYSQIGATKGCDSIQRDNMIHLMCHWEGAVMKLNVATTHAEWVVKVPNIIGSKLESSEN